MLVAEILEKGGPVVWVLLAYSFVALVIVTERVLNFVLMKRLPGDFEQGLTASISEGRVDEYLASQQGPDARIINTIKKASDDGVINLESVASRCGSEELIKMERGFRTLAILGQTAPLLGLLGTIIGMIKAFMVIEVAGGQVDAQALAGGIWEAMLTTGVGLTVAIPILLVLHMLETAADKRAYAMRRSAMILLERLPHTRITERDEIVHHREGGVHAV